MKAVHFGAGNIGRGFVGLLLHEGGYEVVFSDVSAGLVDAINAAVPGAGITLGPHLTFGYVLGHHLAGREMAPAQDARTGRETAGAPY